MIGQLGLNAETILDAGGCRMVLQIERQNWTAVECLCAHL